MPVLTAPPEIELPSISFFGRSLDEYVQFFALDTAEWRTRAVLDVAAGPSSFTAEACRRGIDAVAVDPLYGSPVDALANSVQIDYARMLAQMRAKPRLFKVGKLGTTLPNRSGLSRRLYSRRTGTGATAYFSSINAAESDRRAAAQRFLSDYETHLARGRYIGAALPRLPFFDRAFDIVLCAHLLFTYSRHFNFDWHVAACRELARVSAGEVRIHPVCGPDGRRYSEFTQLQRELLACGIASKLVPLDYEFFVGSNSMLVLNRSAAPP